MLDSAGFAAALPLVRDMVDESEFARWLLEHEIIDALAFPGLGSHVWLPEGIRIRNRFCEVIGTGFSNVGFVEVALPTVIPEDVYTRQPAHFAGLSPLTYRLVAADGSSPGFFRTTSETPFSFLFRKWGRLPARYFQVVTVARHERDTRLQALFRTREIHPFIESYSAVESEVDAQAQVAIEVALYQRLFRAMGLPCVTVRRPSFDTFPEARYTIALDVPLPDGRVIQAATVHNLGTSFGDAFGLTNSGGLPVWQTSTGISGRALGCCLYIHRDSGVRLPYALSPYQILITGTTSDRGEHTRRQLVVDQVGESDGIHFTTESNERVYTSWFRKGGCFAVEIIGGDIAVVRSRDGPISEVPMDQLSVASFGAIQRESQQFEERAQALLQEKRLTGSLHDALTNRMVGLLPLGFCGAESCLSAYRNELGQKGQILGTSTQTDRSSTCGRCGAAGTAELFVACGTTDHH